MTDAPINDPAPSNNSAPRTSPALRKLVFIFGALFVLWLVLGQILPRFVLPLVPATAPPVSQHAASEEMLKQRDQRMDALEARIKTLEDAPKALAAAPTPAPVSVAGEEHVASLETQLKQQNEHIATLAAQVDAWQADGKHQTAALAAFGTLKDTIARGEPFTAPLAALSHLTANNDTTKPLLAQLAPLAETGAPTLATLRTQFETLVPSALAADENTNILARGLQALIHIRKVGDNQQGTSDEAILARAEARLGHGDLAAALHETQSLSPKAAGVLASWNADALSLIGARHALDALELALAQDAPPAEKE